MTSPARLSAARAHVLIQEVLANEFAGQGFQGAATSSPQHAYPQNIAGVIEKYDVVGRRHAIKIGGPEGFDPDLELTEASWCKAVRLAAEGVQFSVEGRDLTQTASNGPDPLPESSPSSEASNEAQATPEAQDEVSA